MRENNEKIKAARLAIGLSQNEFADKFHMKVQTLQKWEQDINKAPTHVVWMIETILDCEKQGYKIT